MHNYIKMKKADQEHAIHVILLISLTSLTLFSAFYYLNPLDLLKRYPYLTIIYIVVLVLALYLHSIARNNPGVYKISAEQTISSLIASDHHFCNNCKQLQVCFSHSASPNKTLQNMWSLHQKIRPPLPMYRGLRRRD
jgi:hypothetical protein